MRLLQLIENLNRTGQGKAAVVGWGRGMGHKGHMYLASSVITQANELDADPYFVVSRTVGKDDPITPEEKMQIYKKVFPKHGHIFHTATDEMPDLTRVLTQLDHHGYTDVTVVVGADQVKALSYVKHYNGTPNKAGEIPYSFNTLNVIARQETNDPSREEEGPRATPMRAVLTDPNANDEQKFQTWRDAMSPEISDDEVRDLMNKAHTRMQDFNKPKVKAKKEKAVAEAILSLKETNKLVRDMRAKEFLSELSTTPKGKQHRHHIDGGQGYTLFRDIGGYDRIYNLNRIMMAAGMADGKSKKPVAMDPDSWVEKYNVAFPYTDLEHAMMMQAFATVPTDKGEIEKRGKSKEPKDTNTTSAVAKIKRNKYGI